MANSAGFSPEFVRRLTPDDRRVIWERGVVLPASPWSYAAPALLEEYRRLSAAKPPQVVPPTEPLPGFLGGIASVLEAMKPNMDFYAEHRDAWKRVLGDTVARVLSWELLALGYAIPRQVDDAPVSIPHDAWAGQIDWEAGKVSGEGLEFVSVRIVERDAVAALLPSPEATQDIPRPVGRPSVKSDVFAAYEALKASGRVDFEAPMKRLFPEIRAWLCETYSDRAGSFRDLADETIRRVIADPFKADRAAKKQ